MKTQAAFSLLDVIWLVCLRDTGNNGVIFSWPLLVQNNRFTVFFEISLCKFRRKNICCKTIEWHCSAQCINKHKKLFFIHDVTEPRTVVSWQFKGFEEKETNWCHTSFFCTSRGAMCAGSAQVTLIEFRRSSYTGCIPTEEQDPKHNTPKPKQTLKTGSNLLCNS